MEIFYLNSLKNNPTRNSWKNEPLSIEHITQLEASYNNCGPFPQALRELLFLAGNYCIVFDYGLNTTQQELQKFVRAEMLEEGRTITRPFFVIDVYNASDQFLFVI